MYEPAVQQLISMKYCTKLTPKNARVLACFLSLNCLEEKYCSTVQLAQERCGIFIDIPGRLDTRWLKMLNEVEKRQISTAACAAFMGLEKQNGWVSRQCCIRNVLKSSVENDFDARMPPSELVN